jgi:hypothetical protein
LDAAANDLQEQQRQWMNRFQQRTGGAPGWLVKQGINHLGWKLPR